MFFENELNGTLTFLQTLVALLFGLAPVALTIAIKVALYRRRLAEDATCQHHGTAEGAHMNPNPDRRTSRRDRRRTRLVRPLPSAFRAEQPLALFVPEPRAHSSRNLAKANHRTDKATLAA